MGEKRVCVVGAGISGLVTCKYLLNKGFHPVIFEADDSIGGVWAKNTLDSTRLQSPTSAYCFSDFPWPETVNGMPHHTEVMRYIGDYARQFDLLRYVRLREKVVGLDYVGVAEEEMVGWKQWGGIGQAFAGASGGPGVWRVTVQRAEDGSVEVHMMDFVVLCLGRFCDLPNIPSFPNNQGPEVFDGMVIHSMDIARMGRAAATELVEGKRVVIIGCLKSALDVAAECSDINGTEHPCTMLFRTKRWIIPDFTAWGFSTSYFYENRFSELLLHKPNEGIMLYLLAIFLSPLRWIFSKFVEVYYKRILPMKKYGMVPNHSFFQAMTTCLVAILPDKFYDKVEDGSIVLRQSKNFVFCKEGIMVDGDSMPIKADLVIFCTGFKGDQKLINIFESPMFQNLMAGCLDSTVPLYRECIHPRIPQLAVIGYSESLANLYTSEMRARWLANLLGGFQLPNIENMEKDIIEWDKFMKRYSHKYYRRSSIGTIHICYNDQLCKDIGCNPKRKKGFFANLFLPYGPLDYVGVG
ncbi:probable flavin-containing monooxygenase 1 [Phalaenopsis equestris]|uniref:probable flavin-containing monooxygenase 1 n=1 Tax=Phalaenopsis equestris TaxID=78828 RepID=UPI0009E50475|nr:probable flavin-containing monooxygenase 1 [Phalaenopsis equestris]